MGKDDIKQSMEKSILTFKEVKHIVEIITTSPSYSLKSTSIDFFNKSEIWMTKINKCKELFEIRKTQYKAIADLKDGKVKINKNSEIQYLNTYFSFENIRFLLMQTYLNISWTLIDNISSIVGEQLFPTGIIREKYRPIKLIEHFIDEKNGLKHLGTNLHSHLFENYSWPLVLFYILRNFFIHEGIPYENYEIFELKYFGSGNPFLITNEFKNMFLKNTNSYFVAKNNDKERQIPTKENCRMDVSLWDTNDLLEWINYCINETDEMLGILLEYGSSLIQKQAQLFCRRDIIQN